MTVNFVGWRKSTRSGNQSNCVEVAGSTDGRLVGIRDTKCRAAGQLIVDSAQWTMFVHSLRHGEIDR